MAKKKKTNTKPSSKKVSTKKGTKRKRRTQDEICEDLRKERARLYSRRYRINKKLEKGVSSKEEKKLNKEWFRIQNRLDKIRTDIFKCGKKYAKLKKQRSKLKRHIRYLKSKAKDATTLKEKNKNYLRIRKAMVRELILDSLMDKPVVRKKAPELGAMVTPMGLVKEDVLFKLPDLAKEWLSSGDFKDVVLDGKRIEIVSPVIVGMEIDEAYEEAMFSQKGYSVAFFKAVLDYDTKTLFLNVVTYGE